MLPGFFYFWAPLLAVEYVKNFADKIQAKN